MAAVLRSWLRQALAWLAGLWERLPSRSRRLRPWMLVVRARQRGTRGQLQASEQQVRRLLERMSALEDVEALTGKGVAFAGDGADYLGDPREVARLVEALIRANPPFLHLARESAADGEGPSGARQVLWLQRERMVRWQEKQTLLVPQEGIEHRESRRPPGYPRIRAARSLSDLRMAPLLYQALPEDYLVARLVEGGIPILGWDEERRQLLFRSEERVVERHERRVTRVPVDVEDGGSSADGRWVYLLLDRSRSLVHGCRPRGAHAVMELAVALAMLRADLGRRGCRYLYRSFADRLDPLGGDPPLVAETVGEKDRLAQRVLATNFSGEATRVVDALDAALADIERWREEGSLQDGDAPRVVLLTDGRTTLYGSVGARLRRLGVALDTVLIGREAACNPELVRVSSSVSVVDPALWREAQAA